MERTTIKYVLQGRYKGENGVEHPWQDESKDEKLERIQIEYKMALKWHSKLPFHEREFRIVERTITETDEVIKES